LPNNSTTQEALWISDCRALLSHTKVYAHNMLIRYTTSSVGQIAVQAHIACCHYQCHHHVL